MEENKNIQEIENNVNKPVINSEEKTTVTPELIPSKKINKGLIAVCIIIIIAMIGIIVYVLFFDDRGKEGESEKPQETPMTTPNSSTQVTPSPTPVQEEPTEEEKNNDLIIYGSTSGDFITADDVKSEDTKEVFRIKVSSKKAKVLSVNFFSTSLLLYDDNGLYIYDNKTKTSTKINLENTYKSYNIYLSEDNDRIIGIGYLDKNNKYGYYNVADSKKLYEGKYKINDLLEVSQVNDHHLTLISGTTAYLLSTDNESVKLSYKDPNADEITMYYYESFGENGNYIYALGFMSDPFTTYERLYSNSYKLFYESKDSNYLGEKFIYFKNNLYFAEGDYENGFNKVLEYNTQGNLITTYTNFTNVKMIDHGYVIYVKDKALTIENIEDSSESKVLVEMKDNWSVDEIDSGYYSRDTLNSMGETNKKDGLYVVVDYDNGFDDESGSAIKDSSGYYGMEYCYTKDKQVVEYPIKEEKGGRAKPVLYLYPEKETNVTVKFAHPEYLTTTYPKYNGSWEITAKPNGDLTDKDGKYYYALYWDETRYSETNFNEGFYVEGKDAIKFLEEKLTIIGLNGKERNEFIMYWLPIMEANGKNLVYFELTDERETNNKLIISPKPNSLLRVSIHIKKVNKKTNIKEQILPTFKRSGFTVVEWGGMTY